MHLADDLVSAWISGFCVDGRAPPYSRTRPVERPEPLQPARARIPMIVKIASRRISFSYWVFIQHFRGNSAVVVWQLGKFPLPQASPLHMPAGHHIGPQHVSSSSTPGSACSAGDPAPGMTSRLHCRTPSPAPGRSARTPDGTPAARVPA